jgi:hypothetical protein
VTTAAGPSGPGGFVDPRAFAAAGMPKSQDLDGILVRDAVVEVIANPGQVHTPYIGKVYIQRSGT